MGFQQLGVGGRRVRNRAGEALEEDSGQRIEVRGGRRLRAFDLLGRSVVVAAEKATGGGERLGLRAFGDAEVGQVRMSVSAHEHVRRLHVSMEHASIVGVVERTRDRREGRQRLLSTKCVGRDLIGQRGTRDEAHRQEQPAPILARIVDVDDVRVLERGHVLPLLAEALGERLVSAVVEHLQRDGTPQLHLLCPVDDCHAADADDVLDLESPEKVARLQDARCRFHGCSWCILDTPVRGL